MKISALLWCDQVFQRLNKNSLCIFLVREKWDNPEPIERKRYLVDKMKIRIAIKMIILEHYFSFFEQKRAREKN